MWAHATSGIVMSGERALHHVASPAAQTLVLGGGLTRHHRAYVLDGLRRRAQCRFHDSFDELESALRHLERCDAVILAPQDPRGRNALPLVERIARDWPGTAMVIFFPPHLEAAPSPRAFALAGAHQFVFEGVNNTAATIAEAVSSAQRESAADAVFRILQPLIPATLQSVVAEVVSHPDVLTSVELLAPTLGVHRKTLVNRCAKERFVPPAELIAWCRLCIVGYMLERSGATVESIAVTQGFASHTALRNLIKRYTGRTATDIRQGGGLEDVVSALRRRLADYALKAAAPRAELPTM